MVWEGRNRYYHQWETEVAMHLEAVLKVLAMSVAHRTIVKHRSRTFKQIKVTPLLFQNTSVSLRNRFVFALRLLCPSTWIGYDLFYVQIKCFTKQYSVMFSLCFQMCFSHFTVLLSFWTCTVYSGPGNVQLFWCHLCSIYWNNHFYYVHSLAKSLFL